MDYKEKYIKYKTKYLFMKNNYLLNNNEENSLNSSNSFIEQSGGDNIKYSKLYVFNRLYQIIEIISYNKFDNKIHISIDDDKLVKLSKINYKKIIDTIKLQPKYKLKYFHTSNREISYPITSSFNQPLNNLPVNLEVLRLDCLDFNHPLDNLPKKLKYLKLHFYEFNFSLDNLPENLEHLEILLHKTYNFNFDNLPKKLKTTKIKYY